MSVPYQKTVYYQPPKNVDQVGWLDWTYKGVDHSFPGNGGPECRDFLSLSQRYWESLAASLVAILALVLAYPRLRLPPRTRPCDPSSCKSGTKTSATVAEVATVYEPVGKRILLLLMCLTFGIELGFKFATRQMIWIGNPCHLATMMQVLPDAYTITTMGVI
ncbi:transmembrane protein 164 [Plakobranchus ocellatus]|uniref:Transmembrane protein 164 n=1 Tax=Plakobranchus ocellatus TaxID=259542 RepID=A0AAV3YU10_9GAST|nr:transmembrane protein 164 [Plakobranchus ocellatus]